MMFWPTVWTLVTCVTNNSMPVIVSNSLFPPSDCWIEIARRSLPFFFFCCQMWRIYRCVYLGQWKANFRFTDIFLKNHSVCPHLLPYYHWICRYCVNSTLWRERDLLLTHLYSAQSSLRNTSLPRVLSSAWPICAEFHAQVSFPRVFFIWKSRGHFVYPSWFANAFDLEQFEKVPVFLMIQKATIMLESSQSTCLVFHTVDCSERLFIS